MQSGRRLRRVLVGIALVAALPMFGQLSVSAATTPAATHAASSSVVSPHTTPFHGLKNRVAAISGARTLQRTGSTGLARKGTAASRAAVRENQFRSRPTSGSSARTASLPIATPPTDALAQFAGISQGLDGQNIAPPDTDMAAGPTDLLETANSALYVLSRSGALLGAIGLDTFMNVTPGYYSSDPRVIYDAASQRYWLTITEVPNSFSCSSSPQPVLIAVSASSNPLPFTSWLVYALPFSFAGC